MSAEQLGDTPKTLQATEDTVGTPDVQQRSVKRSDRKEVFKNRRRKYKEEQETLMSLTTDTTDMSVLLQSSQFQLVVVFLSQIEFRN